MEQDSVDEGWRGFLELCTSLKSPEEFHRCFALFLTIEEKETLASRYLIIRALLEGKMTQREIAEAYKVSIAQITRGSNALKIIDPSLKKYLREKLGKK
jgi:TrpR family transcriptional regulator, trp operon repressor